MNARTDIPSLFRFWLPLQSTWLMMAVEGPLLTAVIARLAEPKLNLAAYGVAFALAVMVEAPVIMMMSAATALADGRSNYRRLRLFMWVLNILITLVMMVLLFSPAWDLLIGRGMGLEPRVQDLTRTALIILLPWPAAIGYRRFYQGLLIRNGRTRLVAWGTLLRLITMGSSALLLMRLTTLQGAWVGATALSLGVGIEGIASRIMARGAVREVKATTGTETLGYGQILHFYYPLALTSTISLLVQPMVTFFLGQARHSLESLAVLPVINALVFIFRTPGLSFQEAAITMLGRTHRNLPTVRRFATLLGCGASLLLSLIALTPLARVWFEGVSGLTPALADFAVTPLRILVLMPALSVWLSLQRSWLVHRRRTGPVTWASSLEVGGILLTLLATLAWGNWVGVRLLPLLAVLVAALPLLVSMIDTATPEKGHEPGLAPNQWFWTQRAYPYGDIRQEDVRVPLEQAREMKTQARQQRRLALKSLTSALDWEARGPVNIGGRVTDIAVHPTNADVAYAAIATGGVFKTEDGGVNWTPIFDDQAVLTVGSVAIDPLNPQTVWVGTGEANASSYSFFGMGIYRSDDGGQTWQNKGLAEGRYIARVCPDHSTPGRVFAAVTGKLFGTGPHRGVYRTTDGGQTWENCFSLTDSTAAIDLVMDPQDSDRLYVAMWERTRGLNYRRSGGPSSGIWRTTDGGDTWQELTDGLPGGSNGRIGIDVCRSQPNVLYASYCEADATYKGVYKSTDGGDTWSSVGGGVPSSIYSTFGWYFGTIRVDPSNPNNVFVHGVPLYRTTNGGGSWFEEGYDMHVDHHAMAFAPSQPSRVYHGCDGGLYVSNDSGDNFTKVNNQPTSQFYAIEIDNQNPQRLYGGTQDNGTWRTLTGGIDDYEHILGGDGFYTLVDPTDNDIIFAEYQYGGLRKSTNGGHWFFGSMDGVDYDDRINWSMPVLMTPGNPDVMYLGTQRVYKSIDQGGYWTPISADLTGGDQGSGMGTITTLAVAPSFTSTLLAGTDDGRVWKYSPLFGNWTLVSDGLPNRWVTRVAFDPNDADIMYVTFSGLRWDEDQGHVFMSTDGGGAWTDISGNLPAAPVNCILVDPDDSDRLYVGTDVGCFVTDRGTGDPWQVLGHGLPNAPVLDMKFHQGTRTLVAGTYGRSMFSLHIPMASGVDDGDGVPTAPADMALANHPNPFNPQTKISFVLGEDGPVAVDVLDARGRLVRRLHAGPLPAGPRELRWDGRDQQGRDAPSGLYLVRLRAEGRTVQHKMALVR